MKKFRDAICDAIRMFLYLSCWLEEDNVTSVKLDRKRVREFERCQIVKIRAMDSDLLAEQETLLTTYREALGLV